MRKRIEDAMAAESYTAEGTAPPPRCASRRPTDNGRTAAAVLRWIDEAANVCGADWAGAQAITSYVAGVRFYRPIVIGDAIEVTARVIHTGPRSIHISVHVTNKQTSTLVARGLTVVVALDERGRANLSRSGSPPPEKTIDSISTPGT